jgi:hypothetical protein
MQDADATPETIETDDPRAHFEASAIHSIYAAAGDLAGIGYTLDDAVSIIARAFMPAPVELAVEIPADVPF